MQFERWRKAGDSMRALKQVLQVTKWSFIDWLMDVRQIFVFIVLICVSNYTVAPLVTLAKLHNLPMNFAEPFLANVNSIYIILIILACWVVLISDYPKMEGNNGYILIRINRMVWLWGKICSFLLEAVFYILELFLVLTVRAVNVCYPGNGWSYLMKEFDPVAYSHEASVVCLVDAKVLNHYTPYQAFITTLLLLFGLFSMLSLIMIAASLGKSKMSGLIINLVLVIIGFAMLQSGSTMRCTLPVANVMLEEQATALIRLIPKYYSGVYFTVACGILLIGCMVLVKRGQIQKDGER